MKAPIYDWTCGHSWLRRAPLSGIWRAALIATLSMCTASGRAAWAGTVSLVLESTQAGASVAPGESIDWSISASVSTGDNLGLALILVDLTQDASNPSTFDLLPAAAVPAAMQSFAPPLGFANPGEAGLPTGYVGVQRGAPGARNVRQIGGAQNTFGGAGLAQGIGQGLPIVVAEGTFPAPAAPGIYTVALVNARANVLTDIAPPPGPAAARRALIDLGSATFSFTVATAPIFRRGDCNGDASINIADAIGALAYLFGAPALTPPCLDACDAGDDGALDIADAVHILSALFSGGPPPPAPGYACGPDPTTDSLGCAGISGC
jgi:hypothetical protein